MKKVVSALPEAVTHRQAFEEYDAFLRKDKPEQVAKWELLYTEWSKNEKSRPSPCIFDCTEPSERLELKW